MRVLLSIHHHLNPNLGAPGATLALGDALAEAGCDVAYYDFGKAFGGTERETLSEGVQYPWRVNSFLHKHAADFDVLDLSSGDAWLWLTTGRKGAQGKPIVVTRSHGLEHTAEAALRALYKETGRKLSWRHPIYHGGWRLRECEISMRLADHCFLLNELDRNYARDRFRIPEQRISIVPNGIAGHFNLPAPAPAGDGPLKLAFLGTAIERKGIDLIAETMKRLKAANAPFDLTIFGSRDDEEKVRAILGWTIEAGLKVVPRFSNKDLPSLLAGFHLLLFPSRAEGFGLALIEAMACGLAPISTPVGIAPTVIEDGANGLIVPIGDAGAITDAVMTMDRDRSALEQMRLKAHRSVEKYRWDKIAAQTIAIYEAVRASRNA